MNGDNPLGFTLGNYNPQHPVRKLRHGGQPMHTHLMSDDNYILGTLMTFD